DHDVRAHNGRGTLIDAVCDAVMITIGVWIEVIAGILTVRNAVAVAVGSRVRRIAAYLCSRMPSADKRRQHQCGENHEKFINHRSPPLADNAENKSTKYARQAAEENIRRHSMRS